MLKLIPLVISFILGSIPFGFIITRLVKKVDIRRFGSGNIGATNVVRVLGKKWGILVFVLDFLKAFTPIILTKLFFPLPSADKYIFVLMAIIAVCGHNWTPFLNFKGGKGVAASLGGMAALSFIYVKLSLVIFIALATFVIAFLISRYVSLASLIAASVFLVASLVFLKEIELKILSFALFSLIVIRHTKNIKNLLTKNENRF
ncbi:MAG: glycerol-3-phosphate 1-O-acyltransferase PlsY [Candidatus Omnitrophica bacterium]|nr:glycerol-3-phosphate 1-O-acyltransferase PlsY [Candidatus Omnitrophota bacterium]